jgi:hypothetical protein
MKNSLNLCFAILLLVVLGCTCPKKLAELSNGHSSPTPYSIRDTPNTSDDQPVLKSGDYDVTMEKYNQLKIGMARAEVENILGGKGVEISNSSGGGLRFSVNQWESNNFKSIILTFKNDKIMTKAQVGLDK